jgi:hypothetical protein
MSHLSVNVSAISRARHQFHRDRRPLTDFLTLNQVSAQHSGSALRIGSNHPIQGILFVQPNVIHLSATHPVRNKIGSFLGHE